MEVWNTFVRQITTLWSQWTLQQRIAISAAAVACLAAVIGTLVWATQPEYMVLAKASSAHEAASIIGKLEAEQISYELSFSGTVISVARGDAGRARLALKDVMDPQAIEDTGSSGMFMVSEEKEEDLRLRQLEASIGRTIEQIKSIRAAKVHISRPDPSPFVVEQKETTASVQVTPVAGSSIPNGVAQSVILTLARAVEGLKPENVTLTDITGRVYTASDGISTDMASQFEFQQRTELSLAHKAESMLDLMLGPGKSVVRVTADIDFREISRTEKFVDPEVTAKISETSDKVSSEGGSSIPGGFVGAGGNLEASSDQDVAGSGKYTRDSKTIEYDNTSTSETVHENPGQIKRITVAAIVDLSPGETDEAGDTAAAATPAVTLEQVEAIVQQAVGFDIDRGDQIKVVPAMLPGPPVVTPEVPGFLPLYEEYKPLIEAALVGLGATIAFFMAVLALRKLRPVIVQEDTGSGFNREDYERMAELSQKARANPEVAARIISAWLGQEVPTAIPETEAPRKSRAA